MSPSHRIVVVGSINSDLVVRTPRLPLPGETVTAHSRSTHNGGKGANQAVALARLCRDVSFVGAVGSDPDGDRLVTALASEGVDTSAIKRSDIPTGLAVVLVDDAGENSIVGVLGANGDLGEFDIDTNVELIRSADVVLVQLEIPIDVVTAAVANATGTVVLNPAPARPLGEDLLACVDYLVPNRTELATLAGTPTPDSDVEVLNAVCELGFAGITVVTLGAGGAIAISNNEVVARAEPPEASVVDTVGAGDAFCAGLVDAIAAEAAIGDALRWAVACGTHATTVKGAQPSMPTTADAEALAGPLVGR